MSSETFTVELRDISTDAATEVLLAIESWAERLYGQPHRSEQQQAAYNALGAIVLPLRAARDSALLSAPEERP